MSEQSEFLKDLDIKDDNFGSDLNVDIDVDKKTDDIPKDSLEDLEMKLKNRRERRLSEKLQAEREANIALNARLQGISESQRLREDSQQGEYLKLVEKIYGNTTPESAEATELLKKAIEGAKQSAKQEALDEFNRLQSQKNEELQKEERELQSMLEGLEDQYNIDLTSQSSQDKKSFLTLLEKLSPKDRDGNIIAFADANTVYDIYQSQKDKSTTSRAKELSNRSLTQSGSSTSSNLEQSTVERFLKENGII